MYTEVAIIPSSVHKKLNIKFGCTGSCGDIFLRFQTTPSLLITLICHPMVPYYSNKQYEITLGQSVGGLKVTPT